MKAPSLVESLFSLKCFMASMLALYLAMRLGLPRPFWAMMTTYVVANPFSGLVRSKALYRVGGTVLGALATLVLVPRLVHAPELLSLALALWVGLCLYLSLLDRTPRSYVFMLAGYTAALISFPTVGEPATIFDVALARVEEICLGIVCATVVHSLVFPQSMGAALLKRLDQAMLDARNGVADALSGAAARGSRDRRNLAGDITELRLMATHLPFDTSTLRWTSNAVHALHDRLAAMIPLLAAVEDRLLALRQLDAPGAAARWSAVLGRIGAWAGQKEDPPPAQRQALHGELERMAPKLGRDTGWSQLLELNLSLRLRELLGVSGQCRELRRHIDSGLSAALPAETAQQPGVRPGVLHRDHRLALMSALAAALAILACCAFWIVTAWPGGATAAMMAAIFCCFFAAQDDPVPGIMVFLNATVASIPFSAIYLLFILPAVHSFEMLALTTAPLLLFLGCYMARPATALKATATLFGFAGTLALQDTGNSDVTSFVNSMLGQLAGVGAAALITSLFRSVSADWSAQRLLRAGWRELARLGQGRRVTPVAAFSARMLDRIGLLTPRLALAAARHGDQADQAGDALLDLRVGLNMTQLLHLPDDGAAPPLQALLHSLSRHFARRPARSNEADAALLAELDQALGAVCAAGTWPTQAAAAAALTSIRRDLFAAAPPYLYLYRYRPAAGKTASEDKQ